MINSSAVYCRSYNEIGGRVLEYSPLEAALRYVSPDGLKIHETKDALSLKSNPIKPFQYWLCRKKGLPAEVGSLIREYHHGPPNNPSRVNLCFLENVAKLARKERCDGDRSNKYCRYNDDFVIQRFLQAALREIGKTKNPVEILKEIQTFYFPITADILAGEHFRPTSDEPKRSKLFTPGQYVHFVRDGALLNGTVKEVFSETSWPAQYSVVCHDGRKNPTYLLKQKELVTHENFQRSVTTKSDHYHRQLQKALERLGGKTSVVTFCACFHKCYYFNMDYERLSWVREKAEGESCNTKDEMVMVPSSELVIHSYLKKMEHFEQNWEPFRIQEWTQRDGYGDGKYAIIPEMKGQTQELFKGYALKVDVDASFFDSFLPQDGASPPAKKLKTDPGI